MASSDKDKTKVVGEILVAWKKYTANSDDEINLLEGDVVELLDINDPNPSKRIKLDPDLDSVSGELLDNPAAHHKLSLKPKRTHTSSRHSPTRLNISQRWLVRQVNGGKKQGWVPCGVLQTADDPTLSKTGLPGDAEFRRQAVVKELIETEIEFVRDLDLVVQRYLIPSESGKVPKIIKDNFDLVFGNFKEIAEFHRTVLVEGVKFNANQPVLIGKTFLRLERDFDKHVAYCRDEPMAQEFLEHCDAAFDYFNELSLRFGDDKSISEHLKLPIQRINDYQLLLKELVRYTTCLGENYVDLQKALDLMLSVPHRAQDDKFISSIEGYKGSVHKLGRLLAHDRFTITFEDISKERYLFLFKARILVCKVRRISEDRSIFQLKDCIRLTKVTVKDHPEDKHVFELIDNVGGQAIILKVYRDVKEYWLKEIREFAKEHGDSEETSSDDLKSPPAEKSDETKRKPTEKLSQKESELPKPKKLKPEPPTLEVSKESEVKQGSTKTKLEESLLRRKLSKELDQPNKKNGSSIPVPKSIKEKSTVDTKKEEPKLKPVEETKTTGPKVLATVEKNKTEQLLEQKVAVVEKSKEDEKKELVQEKVTSKLPSKSKTQDKLIEELKLKQSKVEQSSTRTKESLTEVRQSISELSQSKTEFSSTEAAETRTQESSVAVTKSKASQKTETSKTKTSLEERKSSSISSEDTVVPAFVAPVETTTTTTDIQRSDSETLKQISTPESDPSEDQHSRRLQAVEPLIEINKPRVLEEAIPYTIKPPPEKVPGSAIDKLYSVEKTGVSDIVLTDFKVGIEVNVEVGDEMSRKYTSSSRSEGGYESSYSRRAGSTEGGLSSSRYSSEISSSKYGTDSSLTGRSSKYESLSSKYANKYSTDLGDSSALTSSYSSRKALGGDDDVTSSYTSRKARGESELTSSYSSRKALGDGDNDYSYTRKSRYSVDDDDGGSSYSYSRKVTKDGDDGDAYSSYSKRSSRSLTRTEGLGDDDSYTFSRRSIKSRTEGIGDGDNYSVRRSIKTSVEGTGIEPTETNDTYSYSSKRGLGADLGSKYSIRSVSIEEEKSDTDELLSKYSKYAINKKLNEDEEEDKYAKYTRKYSRNESITDKKDEDENKYTRKYSRTSSREPKKDDEEDPYEKYARKYLRRDSQLDEQNKSRRSESHERKSRYSDHEGESTSVKISSETEIKELSTGKSEVLVSKEVKSESFVQESIESAKSEAKESRAESKVELIAEAKSIEADYQKSEKVSQEASESVSKKSTSEKSTKESSKMAETKSEKKEVSKTTSVEATSIHEKSAEEKLEELVDGRPKFIQTIRGTSIEPGETAQFGITLSSKPASFAWLKNNKPISNADSRIQVSYNEKTHECKLSIKETTKEDSGMYIAVAKNEKGESTCSAQLVVHELTTEERAAKSSTDKPEFLVSMKNAELLEETYLRFMVKVAGEPHPDIAFFKQGKKIPENSERYQIIKEKAHIGFYELVIPVVKKEDAGVYKCVATNKHGEASSEANLTVTDNKKIFEEMPEGEILPAGEKPVFHWKKDGQPFEPEERFKVLMGDDEDSLALVFQKVRPDDVGLYTCVAQTSRGHISCSAELTVHGTVNQLFREPEKPQLVVIKKDPVVNVGGSAMLELQVKGYPKPNIKFMHEGKQIEASKKHKILYEDEESVSLVIKDVESSDAGKYTFTAENELGIDTAEMNLTVKANTTPTQDSEECSLTLTIAPPRIKTKLEDMSVHADQQLKIDIEIEGIPKPTVKFYKDGKVIKESENIKVVESGEKLTLIIEKTSLKDSGSYSVVATNEMAQVSQFWNLEVYSKPKVIQKLGADRQLSQGQNLELKVKLESEPKAEVKWFKDEEEIKSNEHYTIKEDGDSYMLKITGAVTTDAARFKCRALNIHGSVDDEVRVDVKKPPKIIQGLRDMTVVEHDKNVSLDVKLEAFPKPTVKWYLDEVEIKETRTEFTRIESDDGASLIIKEVTSQLSGQYTCKLSNECGGVETSAKLTVNCAPRIIKHLKDTTVEEGSTLHLEVEVEGCPSPTVKWLRNGREVSADARIKITKDTQRHETFNLAVNLIKYEEQGEYEVIVTNSLGTVSSKSIVTVHKVTHTDAIEETEVIEVLEKPKAAKVAEIEEKIEEKVEDPKQPEIEDVEEKPKKPKGSKESIEVKEAEVKSPEPIIEEPQSPVPLKRANSGKVEEAEHIELDAAKNKSKAIEEKEVTKPKRKHGMSLTIEEITEEIKSEPTPVEEKSLEKKTKKAVAASKEDIEVLDKDDGLTPKQRKLSEIEQNKKLKRGISATKEDIDIIEDEKLTKPPHTPDETDLSKDQKRPKKGIKATIEEVQDSKIDDSSMKQKEEKVLERQQSQKGKKIYEEEIDEETEDLLKKAKRQRSLVDDMSGRLSGVEAEPMILGTNMKDGSRPESLDITYIVKGFANPPPVATWTLDGKELKPDGNLRMNISQNGDEYKLEIKKLELKDAGVYQCILSNPVGKVVQQAVLDVTPEKELRRPKIKEALKDQSIVKKTTAAFKAVIVGDPVPDIAWCKNGKEISDEEFEKQKAVLESEDTEIEDGLKECTYSLALPRCETSATGKYTIKAKNKWGEAESSAHLSIVMRPEIDGPHDVKVVPGDATEFTVVIQANPEPQVVWTKDGVVVQASDLIKIVEDKVNKTYKLVFNQVLLGDEGYYKVTATNELGDASSEARLKTITERPKFITGLVDDQVEHKGEVTLMVRADGLPKPEIRWFFNGKPITEDDNRKIVTTSDAQVTSKLIIKNFGESTAGIYKAMAINVVGEAETTSRVTMLQTPPSFGKKLDRNMDVNEGEPLELKAKVNGSPKPEATWFKDGEPISPDDENIKISILPDGTIKLNIAKCKPSDSGAYKLVVKNPNGESACLCAVAVIPKPKRPTFLKCFKDAQVPLGESVRLEAKVEAYPPPEIKWLKDGVPVRASSNVRFENYPDGRVALVVDVMKPETAGNYKLLVTNKLGEAIGEAKVEVEKKPIKPEFIQRLFPQTVVEGFPVKLEVKAEGFPAPKISWFRNGAEVISDNKHIKIIEQPDGSSALFLDCADIARDALTYKAVASNEAGESDTSAALTVKEAAKPGEPEERPLFLHSIKNVITDEGQPLVIEAPFTGNPIPSAEWTKDGEPLLPSERVLMTCDGRRVGLKIDKAVPSDAGVYGVKIINPLGEDKTQGKATVRKVFMAPSFTQRFTDLQQLPNRDAKLPCRVTGVPQPEVMWTKDGQPIKESDKYHIKRDGDLCCLYILDCQPTDAGIYRATAVNQEGHDDCTATVEVVKEIKAAKRIEAPVFLKRIGDTELYKAMTAKFTACASGIPEPTVEWFHNDKKIFPSTRIKMDKDTAGLLRLTISGVDVDDLGKYSCKIYNEHGSDICHASLKFEEGLEPKPKRPITDQYTDFDKYKKSGAPMPISDPPIISQMTDRHCTLSWKPSIPSGPRVPVTYQLEMCELPSGDWFTVRSGIRSCTCGVRNLEPFRDYKFRVRVENKYGISDPSPYAITHREKLEPDLPKYRPYLPPEIDFRPETSPYFPKDFDIERPPHDGMAQAPRFLRQEHDTQYGVKDQNTNLFWYVYGYPKPKMTYYFNDELIEPGGRFDMSYTRNGQATLFINKMLERDAGCYEAVARNEHGEARQRVPLEIAEIPYFIRRPEIDYSMLRGKSKFEARIIGVPYPEIKWYKDWKPLAPSSRIKIAFIEPDITVLTIHDIILKDEGLYSVSARNVAGSTSASAMLYVEENEQDYKMRNYSNISPIKTKKRIYTDFYDIGDELGRGTQGITSHAVERLNGRNYAAKVMYGSGDFRPFMYNELDMLNELRHKKLISLHEAYETEDSLALILELASGGELVRDYLLKMDYYTESDIAGFIRQLLQGLDYMHDRGYAHMGLDLGDLLISHPGGDDLKITDFSLSRRIQHGNFYPLKYGMPEYVSPEVANGDGVGYGQDMWSVGIITYILLSGRSPFRGENDRETLTNIREGRWSFYDEWWSKISLEARDFISKLLVYDAEGRMDIRGALRHPWLERADKKYTDEFQIRSKYLSDYWRLYREWYDNASCRRWFRRRPLEGAFTHPSKMVYPPGDYDSPRGTPAPLDKTPRVPRTWEDQLPTRSPLNYEIGVIKSESHYQNGPDTYLLQLRDVDFPVRLREYMKVAAIRGPGSGYILSDENGYDWGTPIIRERRRFTDIMDEEIDDERKARINRYGSVEREPTTRRIRHELGSRLDAYVEAEAFLEAKQEGRLPFFREKPSLAAMTEGQDLELTCLAVGEPQPIVQWFKNDSIVAESHRIKIFTDADGRSHFKLTPALNFDQGLYKVVARNKIGQVVSRTRIVLGLVPDEPDSPEAQQMSDTEILLTWKQPRFDGNAAVICYSLEYKAADELDWIKKADNIDHEFYLISGLESNKSYIFRLAAKNSIGWSDPGVPSAPVTTKPSGSPKIQLSKAMLHLQQLTDSGKEVDEESKTRLDYKLESSPVEWEDSNVQQEYNFISEIARGKFSVVLKGVDKRNDTVVVAKILDYNDKTREDVEGEFAALRSLRHERIASLLAAYRTNGTAVFILEKLQGADILTYLASRHEYTEQTVATIVSQILDGLQYLHWRGLCHLDLQPDNIVMCGVRSVQIKLVDLGSAHRVTKLGTDVPVVGHPDYILSGVKVPVVGNLDYISPEVIAEEPAFPQSDIWTVGVLTYVMLSGTVPFRGQDENESRQNILFVRYRFENLFQEVTQEATRFLMLLFKRHPNKRPSPEECHENRWLLPTDYMIKKRERAVFLGHRIKEYSEEYHSARDQSAQQSQSSSGVKLIRSQSIQEELLTAP
ncbi:obscurin isoform X2 [Diabrotica virgifera virgifera]|uniref:Obscurin n=1 Tax=Diabrotica virgifera virgifera TaxID=50390 RepID=A0ABM5IQE0_DIAVI|nr:obscurin isoform X2 [Diabrotica virgifera virgifera]